MAKHEFTGTFDGYHRVPENVPNLYIAHWEMMPNVCPSGLNSTEPHGGKQDTMFPPVVQAI